MNIHEEKVFSLVRIKSDELKATATYEDYKPLTAQAIAHSTIAEKVF